MEAKVDPALWNNISMQIGTTAVTGATGLSIVTKIIIGTSIAASVITGGYFIFIEDEPTHESNTKIENKEPQKMVPLSMETEDMENLALNTDPAKETPNNQKAEQQGDEVIDNQTISPVVLEPTSIHPIEPAQEVKVDQQLNIGQVDKDVKKNDEPSVVLPVIEDQIPVVLPTANENNEVNILLPNVFTPNGDRLNDMFEIADKKEELFDYFKEFDVVIFNSNGEVVKTFKGYNFEWDGIDQFNNYAPDGIYSCMIIAESKFDAEPTKIFRPFELCRAACGGN